MIWATYLAHVSVEEGLADGVTMRVPIQTVGLAERVELLRFWNEALADLKIEKVGGIKPVCSFVLFLICAD